MARKRGPLKVVHASRADLGQGEVGEMVKGNPTVAQVFWPDVDKFGYYLVTDLRRVAGANSSEQLADQPVP